MGMMVHTCSPSTWRAGLQNKPLCVSPLHPKQSGVLFHVYCFYRVYKSHLSAPQYFCSGVLDENQDFVLPPVTSPVLILSFFKLPL